MGLLWEHDFSEADRQALAEAIRQAECRTSGEVRVYFEKSCEGEPVLQRAQEAFAYLGMQETADRNGVLFYIAFDDHQFAVIGDQGIHEQVRQACWDEVSEMLSGYFRRGAFVEGLVAAIALMGDKLATYFPVQEGDRNELPDAPYFKNEAPR